MGFFSSIAIGRKPTFIPEKTEAQSEAIPPEAEDQSDRIQAPLWVGMLGVTIILAMAALKPLLPEPAEGQPKSYWIEVGTLFAAELGVALLVAYIISWAIDSRAKQLEVKHRARQAEEQRLEQVRERAEGLEREQRLVSDVFRGVFGIQHSTKYVRKVIETNLEQKVIRRSVSLIYTLSRIVDDAAATLDVESGRFLFLEQNISWTFTNLSTEEINVPIRFAVPVRHGQSIRDASGMLSLKIGEEDFSQEQCVPLPPKAPLADESFGTDDAKLYGFDRKIPALGQLSVSVKIRVVKEESDSDVWCSYYPCTEGMTLQVVAPPDLRMGIRNNTASKSRMEADPRDSGVGIWKIDGAILPNDSVVFYWRTGKDDGEPLSGAADAERVI